MKTQRNSIEISLEKSETDVSGNSNCKKQKGWGRGAFASIWSWRTCPGKSMNWSRLRWCVQKANTGQCNQTSVFEKAVRMGRLGERERKRDVCCYKTGVGHLDLVQWFSTGACDSFGGSHIGFPAYQIAIHNTSKIIVMK